MEFSIILSNIAGLGYLLAYLDYNRSILNGDTRPNGATWAIWSTIALISSGTYFSITDDLWKSLLPIINILLCIGTFVLAITKRKFSRFNFTDSAALYIVLAAAVVWLILKSAVYGNLIVQISIIIGFMPTWRKVWKDPSSEHSRPWWLWSIAYCLSIIVVTIRWKGEWIELVYPVSCTILHASVPVLSLFSSINLGIVQSFADREYSLLGLDDTEHCDHKIN